MCSKHCTLESYSCALAFHFNNVHNENSKVQQELKTPTAVLNKTNNNNNSRVQQEPKTHTWSTITSGYSKSQNHTQDVFLSR